MNNFRDPKNGLCFDCNQPLTWGEHQNSRRAFKVCYPCELIRKRDKHLEYLDRLEAKKKQETR